MDVFDDAGAGWQVKPDRGFVEQQKIRLVEQSARNLDPPPETTAEFPNLLPAAVSQLQPFEFLVNPCLPFPACKSMQRCEVTEILDDGQIQVQGRLLKHHAHAGEGFPGLGAHIPTTHANRARRRLKKVGDDREQGGFPRAIGPEENRELASVDRKANILQRETGSLAEPKIIDIEHRHLGSDLAGARVEIRVIRRR
jgi:hypothetical protein